MIIICVAENANSASLHCGVGRRVNGSQKYVYLPQILLRFRCTCSRISIFEWAGCSILPAHSKSGRFTTHLSKTFKFLIQTSHEWCKSVLLNAVHPLRTRTFPGLESFSSVFAAVTYLSWSLPTNRYTSYRENRRKMPAKKSKQNQRVVIAMANPLTS